MTPDERLEFAKKLGINIVSMTPEESLEYKLKIEAGLKRRREREERIRALPEPERSRKWDAYMHLTERMTGQDYDELVKRFPNFTTFDEDGNDL